MSAFDSSKDYYAILGADANATRKEIEQLYKRRAALRHPDRGGSEEAMKLLNEAYHVLKDESKRRDYDALRRPPVREEFSPVTTPTAEDIGLFGQGLSAFLCLLLGMFLLLVVRFQFIWFLWPLGVLAVGVLAFGVFLARGAMQTFNESLPQSNLLRGHAVAWELAFWSIVGGAGYGLYLLMTA